MGLESTIKGWTGELLTITVATQFLDQKEYHVFHDVSVPGSFDKTQIAHVIVSKYGIFVIETKNKNGWIFGKCYDKRWAQTFYNKRVLFQNPLRQNFKHIKYLSAYLNIDHTNMHSVVVFWGNCEFQIPMPSNVLNSNYVNYVRSKKEILLTDPEVEECCRKIQEIKDKTSLFDGEHLARRLEKLFRHN